VLHELNAGDVATLKSAATAFIDDRGHPGRVGRSSSPDKLAGQLHGAISAAGLGIDRAWHLFESAVAANTFDLDGPRFLAFIPMAPATSAVWMDAAVGAACFSGESWLEASGAVAAENQALETIREWVGLPEGSGGAFCSGGSAGNFSALAVARDQRPGRTLCVVADTAHASVATAAHLLGLELAVVPTPEDGRLTGPLVLTALDRRRVGDVAAVVGSAGSTNAGVVDDLGGLADAASTMGAWFHVDGAYGGAALALERCRPLFQGVERADTFIVDPHKWLFSTAGACALLYRNPALAVGTHRQRAPYIESLHSASTDLEWNPSDFAFQLTRRASGLPFWFMLAAHGTDAVAAAVEVALDLARYAASAIDATPHATVVRTPELGVVLFRRAGWGPEEWRRWAFDTATRGIAFVAPTTFQGEVVGRLVFINPRTTTSIVDEVVETLSESRESGIGS
jgi:aromatic-L-amino-acid decarboxylase